MSVVSFLQKKLHDALNPGAANTPNTAQQTALSAENEPKTISPAQGKKSKPDEKDKRRLPKSTLDCLHYEQMLDTGICSLGDNCYSRTIQISDINYQTARREEQVDLFSRYCENLNALDPQVHLQITIINRHIDKQALEAQTYSPTVGDGLDEFREEYNQIIAAKALEGQNSIIRDRYVTFSTYAPTVRAAHSSLARIEAEQTANFKALGCSVAPMTGLQRLQLLQSILRPGTQFRFSYDQCLLGVSTKEAIAPMTFDFDKRGFTFEDFFAEVLILRDLPNDLSDKLLTDIADLPIDMAINLHIDRMDQTKALELVRRKIALMEMEQTSQEDKAVEKGRNPILATPASMRRKYAGAVELLEDLEQHNQRLFDVTILIYTFADSEEKLKENVAQIRTAVAGNTCSAVPLDYRQLEGFNSTLPLGKNFVEITRTLTTASTAIFIPFTTQELYQPGGMYYGLNALSRNMIFFSRYTDASPDGIIVGSPGSGKSFAAKREMIGVLLNDPNAEVLVIDPEREYSSLAMGFNGAIVRISAGSQDYLNPMDITQDYDKDDPLLLKSEFILSLMELLIGGKDGLTGQERSIISRVCMLCYQNFFARNAKMPTLATFYEKLKEQKEPEAQRLALSLEIYIHGALSVFSHETNVDIDNRFIVFDLRDLGNQLRTFGMLVVLDQIWNRVIRNRAIGKRTWIYIDEMQLLLTNEYAAQYFFDIWSRARKWGGVPTGITQNTETLLLSDLARRMLSNSDFIQMFNQSQPDRVELAGLLNMSNKQLSYITGAQQGCGLLFAGKSVIPFADSFPRDTKLYKMMTTKIEELVPVEGDATNGQENTGRATVSAGSK